MSIGEDGLQIVVGEVGEFSEGHDGRQLSRLHVSRTHHLQEHGLVVVTDAGGVLGDVGAGDLSPWSLQDLTASIGQEAGPYGRSECGIRSRRSPNIFPVLPDYQQNFPEFFHPSPRAKDL